MWWTYLLVAMLAYLLGFLSLIGVLFWISIDSENENDIFRPAD
jgi:hypothetical protein